MSPQADTHPPPEELELPAKPEPDTFTNLAAWMKRVAEIEAAPARSMKGRFPTSVHMIDVVQTHKDGGFYAGCSCGWRSIAYPLKASAEAAMSAHAKAIPGRRREEIDTLVRRSTSRAPIVRRFFARTFRRPRQHRRTRPSGMRGSPDSSGSPRSAADLAVLVYFAHRRHALFHLAGGDVSAADVYERTRE